MKTEFPIYNGRITFLDKKILINDGIFKWHKILQIGYSVLFIIGGIWMITRYINYTQFYMIILGIVFISFGILAIILGLRLNTTTTIDVRQVEQAVIGKDQTSSLNLTIYLKNSQKRKIKLDNMEEDQFWVLHMAELTNTLKELNISTEIK